MGGATEPGVTLQKTLMNHTSITARVANHLDVLHTLRAKHLTNAPYIYGEMNSLYNQGRPGLSDSFGAALWGVDFNLYSASKGIRRSHMHQGSNYRYNAWQPEQTNRTTMGTKAPYYGNVMVAAMLAGRDEGDEIRVLDVPLDKETEGAYAAYVNGKLARIAVVNLQEFNYTRDAAKERPVKKYEFRIPGTGIQGRDLHLQRLLANGSNSISGVTWDGWSYNYELEGGKPVRLDNVTVGETVSVDKRGLVHFEVPDSSGAILNL